ncbi:alpha/beta hydrolase [Fibrivirga algicola]|uniref:Alpha/beta hydrolase n=1 Tax=Fibrivirga algicola TaxID=2950420 RepID=A0ABX0QH03_9BACT|nr:alpha/beta hydrolase-fold protein [Fibrivirga algicola]NID11168.1 alpha/beta hydrolase [Fibrivirga algicola]
METHTLHFELTTPALDDRPVYITGNFCGWSIDHGALRLYPAGKGCFTIDLPVDGTWPDPIEYKYYRGGEGSLELDEAGGQTGNRVVPQEAMSVRDEVPYWQWQGQAIDPAFLPVEYTLHIPYPGSDMTRRVQVALPYDYETSGKSYPVLYLNDGQNLMKEGEGYGSWATEVRLAQLASRGQHEVIVVAIDHAGSARMAEYTVEAVRPGLGEGRTYLSFVVNTIKPVIDATFRTLPDGANTGMGGSSLGGLISVWAGLLYPDVFGKWLVFSPALWISPGVYRAAKQRKLAGYTKVYLYGGESESKYMVPNLNRLQANLRCDAEACAYLQKAVDPTGLHEENRWSLELTRAIQWLFFNDTTVVNKASEVTQAVVVPY